LSINSSSVTVVKGFCPGTVKNLQLNPAIAIVVWDAVNDIGHQLIGEVEKIEETAMLNGYAPEIESSKSFPQAKRDLIVRVDTVLAFSHAPHNDMEE
jgi:hypothetical protein